MLAFLLGRSSNPKITPRWPASLTSEETNLPVFSKLKLLGEAELHTIIEKEIDALEEGLVVLKHEFETGRGPVDFLCVDSGGRLVMIEIKKEDDENVLFQALRYYDAIDKQRPIIALIFAGRGIKLDEEPRIVIISSSISDDLRSLSTLVKPDVELYEYDALKTLAGEQGITYHPVSLPIREQSVNEPTTLDDFLDYLTDQSLRKELESIILLVKSFGKDVKSYFTQGYIGFKFKGRQIAYITTQRKSFEITAVSLDDKLHVADYQPLRISSLGENYADLLDKIKASYEKIEKASS